eukprot:717826-Karenia_brevis.AAC.1
MDLVGQLQAQMAAFQSQMATMLETTTQNLISTVQASIDSRVAPVEAKVNDLLLEQEATKRVLATHEAKFAALEKK